MLYKKHINDIKSQNQQYISKYNQLNNVRNIHKKTKGVLTVLMLGCLTIATSSTLFLITYASSLVATTSSIIGIAISSISGMLINKPIKTHKQQQYVIEEQQQQLHNKIEQNYNNIKSLYVQKNRNHANIIRQKQMLKDMLPKDKSTHSEHSNNIKAIEEKELIKK